MPFEVSISFFEVYRERQHVKGDLPNDIRSKHLHLGPKKP